nr:hypothetical protein [Tanacetum cinerariifolium]
MSREVLTVGSTMRIPLLYRGEYSQWVEKFMNYLEEQTDGEAMINSIKNGDQPLPRVTQMFIAGTSSTEQPPFKDKSMWSNQEKKNQKIDCLARSLLIQGLSNDISSLIDSNKTAKDLWDALARHMLGSEYGEQDRKAAVLYEYETSKLKKENCDVNDATGLKNKTVVVTSDPLALIAEKTKVSKRKEKVVVSSDSKGSDSDDFSELKKITALLAKAFNQRKFYSKPTNNNLRTSSTSQSANKKQEFVKTDGKKVEKKDDEKKRDMSKTKMLLAKKDRDEQVLLAEEQAWMESSSDSDKEINAKMKKTVVVTSDPLALIAEKIEVSKRKEKVVVSSDSEGNKSMWSNQEKKIQKIDRLARSLLIQGLPNDISSLIDSNKTTKDLWDALARHMLGSEYGEQDRKAAVLYDVVTQKIICELNFKFLNNLQPEWKQYATMMRQTKNLMDINIDALYNILKQNQGDVNDSTGLKNKTVVVTSDPLALIAEKTKVSKRKEKVVVFSDSEGSDLDDFSELKKITASLAKAFNQRKFYSKPTNNNLRTSSTSQSASKKQEFVKTDDKIVKKKDDEKKRDMSKVKCYN